MKDTQTPAEKPSAIKIWWIALRPFSFPASVMSVLFGAVLAVVVGGATLNLPLMVLAALGMAILHGAANILNDVYDYKKGLDKDVLPVSGAIVRGYLTTSQAVKGAAILLLVGVTIGLAIAWAVGWVVFTIGIVGVAIGALYSATPAGLKYNALGDLAVFLNFGILGALGGWVTQSGSFAWLPILWSIPLSLLVVGILHANNWRDIEGDNEKGCRTVASMLGDGASVSYYAALLFTPFLLILGFIVVPRLTGFGAPMPLTFALTLLALPLAARLLQRGVRRRTLKNPLHFAALDGATAQLNMLFGLLCTIATIAHHWVEPWSESLF